MGNNNFLLQTENTDPLVKTVQKLNDQIIKNDQLISNLLETSDSLKFPKFDQDGNIQEENSDNKVMDEPDKPSHNKSSFDELRYHLDTKYRLPEIECPDFNQVENPRIRQLLADNYRLLTIYNIKKTYNRELVKILKKYQHVLMNELIPSLGNYNYRYTSNTLDQFQQILETKLLHDQLVYSHYIRYSEYLQRFYDLLHELMVILNCMDSNLPGIEAKLLALDSLMYQVSMHIGNIRL